VAFDFLFESEFGRGASCFPASEGGFLDRKHVGHDLTDRIMKIQPLLLLRGSTSHCPKVV
jgi:hypothetical protein